MITLLLLDPNESISIIFIVHPQRYKSIQPGCEEKIINRKVPKAKLLECIKDNSDNTKSLSSSIIPGTPRNTTTKQSSTPANGSLAGDEKVSNKTISPKTKTKVTSTNSTGKLVKKKTTAHETNSTKLPQNTIRSMFLSQLEKQKEASTPKPTVSDISSSNLKAAISSAFDKILTPKKQQRPQSIAGTMETPNKNGEKEIIVPGSAHKRLTRRNSMVIIESSPDECNENIDNKVVEEAPTPLTPKTPQNKMRRRTMFTPGPVIQTTIQEEDDLNELSNGDTATNVTKTPVATITAATTSSDNTKTNPTKDTDKNLRYNNKMLVKSLIDDTLQLNNIKKAASTPGRRTIYTPVPMEETVIQMTHKTPIRRRSTMNFNIRSHIDESDLFETASCDAVLSPSSKTPFYGKLAHNSFFKICSNKNNNNCNFLLCRF